MSVSAMTGTTRKPGRALVVLLTAALLPTGLTAARSADQPEAPFLAQNDAAMRKMMADMAITPSGDVDRDFVDMMVPHHQGAIDMAVAVLRYGHNEKIRRLAQEIIVTQQEEIIAMRRAVGEPAPAPAAAPTTAPRGSSGAMDMGAVRP
jgi:hypothetical protein